MSASFIRVWWKSNDPKTFTSDELKEGAPPDRGKKEMNVLFLRSSGLSDVGNAV